MATFIDTALAYNPVTARCDLVFDGTDLAIDNTPVTPVLLCVGLDRRAHADDPLPDPTVQGYSPATLNARRGWCGDFMDALGRLAGSRMWIVRRMKWVEQTRLFAEAALREPLEILANTRGIPISVEVRLPLSGLLCWRVNTGPVSLSINVPVG